MKFKGKVTNYSEKNGNTKRDNTPYIVRSWRIEEVGPQYPNSLMVESYNKEFGRINVGDIVEAEINTKCDLYEGKMYNKISAWKITVLEASGSAPSIVDDLASEQQKSSENDVLNGSTENIEEDLPF
jgi:hypothetical protein